VPPGKLWLVGTPIGNLEDITSRARRILSEADLIAAEDTRRTGRLLQKLGVEPHSRLVSFFEGNEERRLPELLSALRDGSNVAAVTDGGMPSVSDPGYRLVAACVERGIEVDVAPGPSAALAALVISGLPTDRWVFEGFLPRSGRAREERLHAMEAEPRTVVLFESPRRVVATLSALGDVGGGRRVAVCRELTKLHQDVLRGPLEDVLEKLRSRELKGEVVIVLEGARSRSGSLDEAVRIAAHLLAEGSKKRDAAREAAIRTGIASGVIYAALLEDRP